MSSNIRIEKSCEYCHQPYIARTLHTRYCSHSCNQKAYKNNQKAEKLHDYYTSTENNGKQRKVSARADLKDVDYLCVKEVCLLLNLSRGTIFRWIKEGVLVSYQHRQKHIICKKDIEKIFNYDSKEESPKSNSQASTKAFKERRD
jgi:excisionase family DNA binding protein